MSEDIEDIVEPVIYDFNFFNSLPEEIQKFLENYGVHFYSYEPFIAWLKNKGVSEQDLKELFMFDPFKGGAWEKLADGKAIIMLVKSRKANINDHELLEKLKQLSIPINVRAKAYVEKEDKDKEYKYDPNSVQHRVTIIISKDQLSVLESLSELILEQRQIFPSNG